ncbi:MAG: ABC transporter substrate-binding protein [Gemmatimonadota bacterium]|nr:ABC transporter substrate-binding protein [Gemmatimonadota bacterium]
MVRRCAAPLLPLPLALLAGLSACGTADRDGAEPTDGRSPSTLRILFESDDYVLGPSRDDWPKFLVFEPLVRHWGTGAQPALATSWEHSDDFRTWTFHLRDDVRWHDGVPVTAHDVAYSLELFRSPDIALHGFALGIASISVPNEHTLALTFNTPRGPNGALAGWPVFYPKHLIEELDPADFFDWEFWKGPIGNGPYRYVRRVSNTMVELEANADYYAGPLAIDRIILRLSTANPVLELTSGNVDAVYYLSSPELAALGSDDRFRTYVDWVHSEPQAIHWNQRHPFLADAAVRRALAHAIDRRELARLLFLPDEMPLTGGFLPDDRADDLYAEGWDQGPAFDPDRARALLEEAGWRDLDRDGVRGRDGVDAEFTLLARQGGILSTLEAAVLLQDQLAEVGVAVEIRPTEGSLYRELFRAGDFDATVNDVRNVPAELLRDGFFGEGTRIGYRNPEVERRLDAIRRETDPAAQESLYVEVNEILRRDMPFTWLFPYFEAYAAHRKVRGLRSPDRSNPIAAIRDIWIEDDGGDP